MNRLDTVSYYLSYTEFVPILSIPSGIIHLTCAIRDRYFGAPPSIASSDTADCISLASRKLDDWTHVTKGVLALIPLLGNAILVFKWLNRVSDLYGISLFLRGYGSAFLRDFPEKLFNDKEFLLSLFKAKSLCSSEIFERLSRNIKNDKSFVLSLVNNKILKSHDYHLLGSLKEDFEVTRAIIAKNSDFYMYFLQLPETFKNDLEIVKAIFIGAKEIDSSHTDFIKHVPNKGILKDDEELCVTAVRNGIFKFQELDTERQNLLEYGIAAVLYDHHQWDDLPSHLKKNKKLLHDLVQYALFSTNIGWEEMIKAPWFQQFFPRGEMPSTRADAKHTLKSQEKLLLAN